MRNRPSTHASSGPGPHEHGIGLPAHEQLDGVDDERLARAGLPRERGHAGAEDQAEVLDDPKVSHC